MGLIFKGTEVSGSCGYSKPLKMGFEALKSTAMLDTQNWNESMLRFDFILSFFWMGSLS